MILNLAFLFLSAAVVAQTSGQRGTLDPAFEKIPFDKWLGEGNQAHFRWTATVSRIELSFHQRLVGQVEIKLDGKDLETRRGNGQLVLFIQITDRQETRYQNHGSIDLSKLDENVKGANIEYSQPAFFLPGDYRLAIVILDTASGEHSAIQANFRVASPRHDFLAGSWRDLEPVEFIEKEESPESWYLPGIRGRLQWAAAVHSPVQMNVILNIAPSVPMRGSRPAPSSGLDALLPTLKVISQTQSSSISEKIDVLDLARRRAVFQQSGVHDLDWLRLKASLEEASTASIDVHSLSEQHHDAQFFVATVRRLLGATEKPSVLVVLTTPVAFESGEDLAPISPEGLPNTEVFYIRYRVPVTFVPPFAPQRGGWGRGARMGGDRMSGRTAHREVIDQLASTLKPLNPKIFDVETSEQMTRALIEIEKALLVPDGQYSR